ncbi:MAG: hypothetical protein VX740_03575 [Pseudomonadota bacterium]|nr:hypothetical protein [Pseudomonadota bacterium]MEC9235000.1 hypothetical protein [Pseudomonadota bacterium]MED5422500.1 hypothetical protein [Pseudomonadota bacterium]MEE3322486.1 hypothetical protein [Pseudomonadota bacterium]
MRCWVIFSGVSELWFLKFLRPGFRHCFIVLNDGRRWLSIDPMAHYTEVISHDLPATYNVINWIEQQNCLAVEVAIEKPPKKVQPPMLFTCVEMVKRMIGLRAFGVITPWQLYKAIKRRQLTS